MDRRDPEKSAPGSSLSRLLRTGAFVMTVTCSYSCAGQGPWWFSEKTSAKFTVEQWDISLGVVCPQLRGRRLTGELMLGCQFALYASRHKQAGDETFEVDSIWALDPFSVNEGADPYLRTTYARLNPRVRWQTSICIPREYELASNPPLCSYQCVDNCGFELQEGDRVHARVFCRLTNRLDGGADSAIVLNGVLRAPLSWRAYFKGLPPTAVIGPDLLRKSSFGQPNAAVSAPNSPSSPR